MATTTTTNVHDQPRKTLAGQLDRLDGILDGLEEALAGAVQDAVATAVKEAVQAGLNEVLTNRDLQIRLQQPAPLTPQPEAERGPECSPARPSRATAVGVRRIGGLVRKVVRGAGMALLGVGVVVAGVVSAARRRVASAAAAVYRHGKRLLHGAFAFLTSFLPSFALGG
jgi:hypothetical protein